MADPIKIQIQQKTANGMQGYYPETSASIVNYLDNTNNEITLSVTNIQDAIDTIKSLIKGIQENIGNIETGGIVTGVKGSSETTYRTGQVNITKANIGLGNVTNEAQIPLSMLGKPEGAASLGADGKVPASQLPSYVDDVLEYDAKTNFPATGTAGVIYVSKNDNKTYRWGGTAYVEISASLALGETSSTAYAGNKGKANADNIKSLQTHYNNLNSTVGDIDEVVGSFQDSISKIVAGTTKVGSATVADSAGKLTTGRKISITGDATGNTTFDGSADKSISITLANSGVTAGTYSAVQVNAKGLVTSGGQFIEIGATTSANASTNLVVGGLFFKRLA